MVIGLALGSGSARGWAHIGVINALLAQGIVPDIVCGASVGSLVGAAYVAGNLKSLESWVLSLTKFEIARFFEVNSALNGFVNKERLQHFLTNYVAAEAVEIEKLTHRYAAVATDLETGREEWLTRGSIMDAVWASMALPGLFPAIRRGNRWLVDGGLVNPVPVSVCRALGADVVIAVNLNGDIVGRHQPKPQFKPVAKPAPRVVDKLSNIVAEYTGLEFANNHHNPVNPEARPPGLFEAIASSINITQDRITRSRMAGDPPDIVLMPKLSHIGLLEFYRAQEAIKEGTGCVERLLPEIRYALGL